MQRETLDVGFFADFAPDALHDVFIWFEFAAQAVVLAEMSVIGPLIAMDQQHLGAIRGKYVTQRRKRWRERHDRAPHDTRNTRKKTGKTIEFVFYLLSCVLCVSWFLFHAFHHHPDASSQ